MNNPPFFALLVILCIASALTSLVSFVLFLKARTAERDHPDEMEPEGQRRHGELLRKEQLYQSIHFISLFVFVMLGVLLLIAISRRLSPTTGGID